MDVGMAAFDEEELPYTSLGAREEVRRVRPMPGPYHFNPKESSTACSSKDCDAAVPPFVALGSEDEAEEEEEIKEDQPCPKLSKTFQVNAGPKNVVHLHFS